MKDIRKFPKKKNLKNSFWTDLPDILFSTGVLDGENGLPGSKNGLFAWANGFVWSGGIGGAGDFVDDVVDEQGLWGGPGLGGASELSWSCLEGSRAVKEMRIRISVFQDFTCVKVFIARYWRQNQSMKACKLFNF